VSGGAGTLLWWVAAQLAGGLGGQQPGGPVWGDLVGLLVGSLAGQHVGGGCVGVQPACSFSVS
jgi:hypothetical protein